MTKILLATAATAILAVGITISSSGVVTRQSRYAVSPERTASDADGDRTSHGLGGDLYWPRG
jgi:hypothetical protein